MRQKSTAQPSAVSARGDGIDRQKLRLIVNGAISVFEGDGLEIPTALKAQERTDLCEAYDMLGAALYWLKNELEP